MANFLFLNQFCQYILLSLMSWVCSHYTWDKTHRVLSRQWQEPASLPVLHKCVWVSVMEIMFHGLKGTLLPPSTQNWVLFGLLGSVVHCNSGGQLLVVYGQEMGAVPRCTWSGLLLLCWNKGTLLLCSLPSWFQWKQGVTIICGTQLAEKGYG